MSTTDKEILDVLRERKLDTKLLELKQLEREAEREPILLQLIQQDQADDVAGSRCVKNLAIAERKLREAEASAAAARREKREIEAEWSHVGGTSQRLRNQLRWLADPRIEYALIDLRGLSERARGAFRQRTRQQRVNLLGDKATLYIGNSLDIGDAMAAIKEASDRLEVLKEQPRPHDLANVIDEIVSPCLERVRKLVGL